MRFFRRPLRNFVTVGKYANIRVSPQVLFYVFIYINHSINFFIYCALARSFRREVWRIVHHVIGCGGRLCELCHWCCSRRRRLAALLSSSTSRPNDTRATRPNDTRATRPDTRATRPNDTRQAQQADTKPDQAAARHRTNSQPNNHVHFGEDENKELDCLVDNRCTGKELVELQQLELQEQQLPNQTRSREATSSRERSRSSERALLNNGGRCEHHPYVRSQI